ncbi:MAG: hypothetical protein KDI90_10460 [Alphaproteobacteria bacterium]|nr:hypothetical protein [Alphaproteobacteria bacterium]MCB9975671.1 hypothetical protein [Rhodospirillales bacterium]
MKPENLERLKQLLDNNAVSANQIGIADLKAVQRILKDESLYSGKIDGDFRGASAQALLEACRQTPSLIASISPAYIKLMRDNGFGEDLRKIVTDNAELRSALVEQTRELLGAPRNRQYTQQQTHLYLLGFYDKKIDGIKGNGHKEAVEKFNQDIPSAPVAEERAEARQPEEISEVESRSVIVSRDTDIYNEDWSQVRMAGTEAVDLSERRQESGAETRDIYADLTLITPPETIKRGGAPSIENTASIHLSADSSDIDGVLTLVGDASGTQNRGGIAAEHLGAAAMDFPYPDRTGSRTAGEESIPSIRLARIADSATIIPTLDPAVFSQTLVPGSPPETENRQTERAPLYRSQLDNDFAEKKDLNLWQRFKSIFTSASNGTDTRAGVMEPSSMTPEQARILGTVVENARTEGLNIPEAQTGYEPYEPLLALIRLKESGDNYDIGHNHVQKNYSSMTINQVLEDQRSWCNRRRLANLSIYDYFEGRASSVAGAYQMTHETLKRLVTKLGLSGEERFDRRMQDRLGAELLNELGYDRYLTGTGMTTRRMVSKIAGVWASFPKDESNESRYKNDGLNKALIGYKPTHDILSFIRTEFHRNTLPGLTAEEQLAISLREISPQIPAPIIPAGSDEPGAIERKDHLGSLTTTNVRLS